MKTNPKNNFRTNQGFIKWIIIIIIALIILGYFGFDIRRAIEAPTTQANFTYVQKIVWNVWNTYLKGIVMYLWNEVILKLFHR